MCSVVFCTSFLIKIYDFFNAKGAFVYFWHVSMLRILWGNSDWYLFYKPKQWVIFCRIFSWVAIAKIYFSSDKQVPNTRVQKKNKQWCVYRAHGFFWKKCVKILNPNNMDNNPLFAATQLYWEFKFRRKIVLPNDFPFNLFRRTIFLSISPSNTNG